MAALGINTMATVAALPADRCLLRSGYRMTKTNGIKSKRARDAYESLGWIGVALVLGSYALLSLGIVGGNSAPYHAFVLAGSVLVAAISYKKRVYQPAILNTAFALLAAIALARIAIINY